MPRMCLEAGTYFILKMRLDFFFFLHCGIIFITLFHGIVFLLTCFLYKLNLDFTVQK